MKIMTIMKEELVRMMDSGEKFKLVDVLAKAHFDEEHIRGAISLPLEGIEVKAADMLADKNGKIVVYCASFECQASTSAARKLMAMGYTNVLDYKGGIKDYRTTGRDFEGTLHTTQQKSRGMCKECLTC